MTSFRLSLGLIIAGGLAVVGCSDDPAPDQTSASAGSNGVCLQTSMIDHTAILSDSAIVFYMKGGKPYLNTLTFPCPSLKFEDGFTYEADFPEICSNAQTIKVLRSGTFCELGQFTAYDPAKPPAAPASKP